MRLEFEPFVEFLRKLPYGEFGMNYTDVFDIEIASHVIFRACIEWYNRNCPDEMRSTLRECAVQKFTESRSKSANSRSDEIIAGAVVFAEAMANNSDICTYSERQHWQQVLQLLKPQ